MGAKSGAASMELDYTLSLLLAPLPTLPHPPHRRIRVSLRHEPQVNGRRRAKARSGSPPSVTAPEQWSPSPSPGSPRRRLSDLSLSSQRSANSISCVCGPPVRFTLIWQHCFLPCPTFACSTTSRWSSATAATRPGRRTTTAPFAPTLLQFEPSNSTTQRAPHETSAWSRCSARRSRPSTSLSTSPILKTPPFPFHTSPPSP